MIPELPTAGGVVAILGTAALHGAIFIGSVWVICRVFPKMPAWLRSGLWWVASAKLLLGVVPLPPVHLPVPIEMAASAGPLNSAVSSLRSAAIQVGSRASDVGTAPRNPGTEARCSADFKSNATSVPLGRGEVERQALSASVGQIAQLGRSHLPALLLSIWGLVALLGFVRLQRQLRLARRLMEGASSWSDPEATLLLARQCESLRLRVRPRLLLSSGVETPQVTGLFRPAILLPPAFVRDLSPAEQAMTLCHELVHVRRLDLFWGWVPALAERLFWFLPWVRYSTREYALAREAACDAEVLRLYPEGPADYGRLLLRFGLSSRPSGLATAGVASTPRLLKRRLIMLQNAAVPSRRRWGWACLAFLAVIGLLPLRFAKPEAKAAVKDNGISVKTMGAAGATSSSREVWVEVLREPGGASSGRIRVGPRERVVESDSENNVEWPSEVDWGKDVEWTGDWHGDVDVPSDVDWVPDQLAILECGDLKPLKELDNEENEDNADKDEDEDESEPWGWSDNEDNAYVFMEGESTATMSGSSQDFRQARRILRREGKGVLLYYRRDDERFVIEDPQTLLQARELLAQHDDLSRRQEELGAEQATLGEQQAELGKRQAEYQLAMAELSLQMAKLSVQMHRAALHDESTDEIDARMEDLSREIEVLGEEQGRLGEQQGELGEKQGEIGAVQGQIGEEQGRMAGRAERALWKLIEEAESRGLSRDID